MSALLAEKLMMMVCRRHSLPQRKSLPIILWAAYAWLVHEQTDVTIHNNMFQWFFRVVFFFFQFVFKSTVYEWSVKTTHVLRVPIITRDTRVRSIVAKFEIALTPVASHSNGLQNSWKCTLYAPCHTTALHVNRCSGRCAVILPPQQDSHADTTRSNTTQQKLSQNVLHWEYVSSKWMGFRGQEHII